MISVKTLVKKHGPQCVYCKIATTQKPNEKNVPIAHDQASRDHVISIKRGGNDDISNLRVACYACNSWKRDMTREEFLRSRFLRKRIEQVKEIKEKLKNELNDSPK